VLTGDLGLDESLSNRSRDLVRRNDFVLIVDVPFDGGALDSGDESELFAAFKKGEGRRIGVPKVAATMFEAMALSREILTLIVLSALLPSLPTGPP
jgi:hypothetical protein